MDIQCFFDKLYDEGKKLELLQNELEVIRARLTEAGGIGGARISGGGSGGNKPHELSDLFVMEDDAQKRVETQKEKVERLRITAGVMVDTLPKELQKMVMRQRYFYLWPWKRISAATHYSITYVKTVRAEAIKFLKK
uniref:hypothetical protein n=1 Tax=Dialister succinatiphilus TaxID=487173 RepID=UPI0040389A60